MKRIDIVGNIYNGIQVLSRVEGLKPTYWLCRCVCGKIFSTTKQRLVLSNTKSCGCLKEKLRKEKIIIHGGCVNGKNSPEYQSYSAMLNRCYNQNRKDWENYGGRGIKVCVCELDC